MLGGTGTFASSSATFNHLYINDSLAGYWDLDEASGTSATDRSGYANTGTLTSGPTWVTWASGNLPGLRFDNSAARPVRWDR